MSWSFGGIAVKNNSGFSIEELLNRLTILKHDTGTMLPITVFWGLKNGKTAIGDLGEGLVIWDQCLPYDCSFTPGKSNSFEERLKELSMKSPVLVFFLDGISETYGFALFFKNECRRKWAADTSGIICNEGDPLEAELNFIIGNQQFDNENEGRVILMVERFLKMDFLDMIQSKKLFSVFQ